MSKNISQHYLSLARNLDPDLDPIAAQAIARPEEHIHLPYESADPIADQRFQLSERIVHRYQDRVLLLVNDTCAMYCRHCFRRYFTNTQRGEISDVELENACAYLQSNPQIREVLLSGGDPCMLSDRRLIQIISRIRQSRQDLLIRLSTRIPVVDPERVSKKFIQQLSRFNGVWLIIQVNHPIELSKKTIKVIKSFLKAGIPVANQAVLLKGVNDDINTLVELSEKLVYNGIRPYYLFQADLAQGTRHFRVNLEKAVKLYAKLSELVSNFHLPIFAVDLPNQEGKIILESKCIQGKTLIDNVEWYVIKGRQNKDYLYPCENG